MFSVLVAGEPISDVYDNDNTVFVGSTIGEELVKL